MTEPVELEKAKLAADPPRSDLLELMWQSLEHVKNIKVVLERGAPDVDEFFEILDDIEKAECYLSAPFDGSMD